jgi:hypothetical protein
MNTIRSRLNASVSTVEAAFGLRTRTLLQLDQHKCQRPTDGQHAAMLGVGA